jgi:hypothetical protein
MANKGGPKKAAYDKQYNAKPEERARRSTRNKARRKYEKANGDLPADVDVNHKRRLKEGGTNAKGNLEATTQKTNRGWRKGKKGYG